MSFVTANLTFKNCFKAHSFDGANHEPNSQTIVWRRGDAPALKRACCGSALPIWKSPCQFISFGSFKSHSGLLVLSLRWGLVKPPTDCLCHMLNESRRAKDAAWWMWRRGVKDALLAISSRPVINHLNPPRGATDRAADGQMSHDKSSARRWHQSLATTSFRLPAPSCETQSDNSFAPISSVFSLLFNYPWLSLFLFVPFGKKEEKGVAERRKKKEEAKMEKLIADCHAVFQIFAQTPVKPMRDVIVENRSNWKQMLERRIIWDGSVSQN